MSCDHHLLPSRARPPDTVMSLNWGIMGCGKIGRDFAIALQRHTPGPLRSCVPLRASTRSRLHEPLQLAMLAARRQETIRLSVPRRREGGRCRGPGRCSCSGLRSRARCADLADTSTGAEWRCGSCTSSVAAAAAALAQASAMATNGTMLVAVIPPGIPVAHGSYEALAADPSVQVVYIGTIHPCHKEQARGLILHVCGTAIVLHHRSAAAARRSASNSPRFLFYLAPCFPVAHIGPPLPKGGQARPRREARCVVRL